jgi:PBP1b-binding outer membrane lipoprotein LpoB
MSKKNVINIIIVLGLLLNGCTNASNKDVDHKTNNDRVVSQNQPSTNEENDDLVEKLKRSVIDQKQLEEERDYYKAAISKLTSKLSEAEMLSLAKEQWKYKLKIDGQLIENQTEIIINKNSFMVSLSQEQAPYEIVPAEIFNKGKISGETYREHIKFINVQPNLISGTDGTVITSQTFSFENIPKDTNIKLEITQELKNRLGLNTNIINIRIR